MKYGEWLILDCGCCAYKMMDRCCNACGHGHDSECEQGDMPMHILVSSCCGSHSNLVETADGSRLFIRTHTSKCVFANNCQYHSR